MSPNKWSVLKGENENLANIFKIPDKSMREVRTTRKKGERDRQTDKETDRERQRQTDKQTERQREKETV